MNLVADFADLNRENGELCQRVAYLEAHLRLLDDGKYPREVREIARRALIEFKTFTPTA
jgi:cell division protein FtsB